MKQTLLQIVQDLLSEMDSDEVNSISDTAEAEQVARIVRRCYYDIVEEHDLPSKGGLIKLESASSVSNPTRLKLPDRTSSIDWIKYADLDGTEKHYRDVQYVTPSDFIDRITKRDPGDSNIVVVSYAAGLDLPIMNDRFPNMWTAFDDKYIYFDSWDSTQTSTIVANHTMCFGHTTTAFELDDDAIPHLPDNLFPYLYYRAKTICFADIKQSPNVKAEQSENRLRIRSQRNKWRSRRHNNEGPDFGKR